VVEVVRVNATFLLCVNIFLRGRIGSGAGVGSSSRGGSGGSSDSSSKCFISEM
jgi:hypothetical protein